MFDYARTWLALRTDKRGVTAMEYRTDRRINGSRARGCGRYTLAME